MSGRHRPFSLEGWSQSGISDRTAADDCGIKVNVLRQHLTRGGSERDLGSDFGNELACIPQKTRTVKRSLNDAGSGGLSFWASREVFPKQLPSVALRVSRRSCHL